MKIKTLKVKILVILIASFLINYTVILSESYSNILDPPGKEVTAVSTFNQKLKKDKYVYLGGTPLGIKLKSQGLLVVAISDIEGKDGKIYRPALECDIRIGDIITEVNNVKLTKSQDITDILNCIVNDKVTIKISRNDKVIDKLATVAYAKDGCYKLGVWVRESMAGVGTLTFYEPESDLFAALGHAVTDSDTNEIFKISTGRIVESSISSVKKGEKGNPGELRGIFIDEESPVGEVKINTITGVYGFGGKPLIRHENQKLIKIGSYKDIKEGSAKILTTIDGQEPQFYDIKIEKLLEQKNPSTKSMIITITDKELLERTGGIVQGMSGSPIIQNNKLIGAVTHVLVNRPDTGYGIYIDWMFDEMSKIS
ncbi:SpoIVB peptidase [Clostridium cellulovorans]|uniref:Stage IV sporulation protein B n=1 Tax=Clostridium cellulovorans (strain ATCC 35296 / DSM 3052 / OCM 3 / 743B) TaxID=573061 RepID=D9SLV5_CLOC7|nr:SpoIVB peptidase [Clostridium cellulovorans]ADL51686.1 stage IV sporulation protein B [Clostridium cellulovorans 743B]